MSEKVSKHFRKRLPALAKSDNLNSFCRKEAVRNVLRRNISDIRKIEFTIMVS
jgi:hypothetical protein